MIKTIIIVVLGIIIGVISGVLSSKVLIKRHKKQISKYSTEKILEQTRANLKTLQGKPIPLNFITDGKVNDLKKQVQGELAKAKLEEIKKYREKVMKIKKAKKEVEKIKKLKKAKKKKKKGVKK